MAPTEPPPGPPPATEPPLARTLDFGTSATASLLVKMNITHAMNERRDQMIVYSLFEKLMRSEMPQGQAQLDAAMADEGQKEALIEKLATSWIYEQLVTNVKLCGKMTDTKLDYSHLYSTPTLLPHWDVISATGSPLLVASRGERSARAPSTLPVGGTNNTLVTSYKPPRLTDKCKHLAWFGRQCLAETPLWECAGMCWENGSRWNHFGNAWQRLKRQTTLSVVGSI